MTVADTGEDVGFFVVQVWGDDKQHRLTNGFTCTVSKHTLGGLVPALDHAREVFAYDRVVGRVDDGCQVGGGFKLLRRGFHGLSFLAHYEKYLSSFVKCSENRK